MTTAVWSLRPKPTVLLFWIVPGHTCRIDVLADAFNTPQMMQKPDDAKPGYFVRQPHFINRQKGCCLLFFAIRMCLGMFQSQLPQTHGSKCLFVFQDRCWDSCLVLESTRTLGFLLVCTRSIWFCTSMICRICTIFLALLLCSRFCTSTICKVSTIFLWQRLCRVPLFWNVPGHTCRMHVLAAGALVNTPQMMQ